MKKTILIFAYYSFKDPVFQSAVLPYFLNFPNKENYLFIILTFEQKKYILKQSETKEIRNFLSQQNILWYKKKWNSGKFKLFKKVFDLIQSLATCIKLIFQYKVKIIYSEGFPGAILTYIVSKITRRHHIIHTFEPHADYMLEAGVWKWWSWEYRFLRKMELVVARNASAILTATDKMIAKLQAVGVTGILYRVPSCVDLSLFNYSEPDRISVRKSLGIKENEILLIYLGKFGGMYWDEELFQLFQAFENHGTLKYKYLIISIDDQKRIRSYNKFCVPNEKLIVLNLERQDVPKYLSAGNCGVCGIRNIPSRRYSSPIKNGEYWSCGLPVIIPQGISDDYLIAEENDIGVVLPDFSNESLFKVVKTFERKLDSKSWKDVKDRAAMFAANDRSVEKYKMVYKQLFENL